MPRTGERTQARRLRHPRKLLMVLLLVACTSDSSTSNPTPISSEPKKLTAQARGLANANSMVENASLCEPDNGSSSLDACKRACELNHSNSCANWGALLENTDSDAALALYARACRGGSGIGCESQGLLEQKLGKDASNVFLNARRYHRIHCSQGYARSCHQLAHLFEAGIGGPAMKGAAQTFRSQACSLGRKASCPDSD